MPYDEDLKCLDRLIAGLGGADDGTKSRGPCDLLLENLQAAKRNLLGSMRGEYRASLRYAKESIACIADKGVRAETKKILEDLLDPEATAVRSSVPVQEEFAKPGPVVTLPAV